MRPRLFFGSGAGKLLLAGSGHQDDGADYDILAQSRELAPAGTGGEAVFRRLYVTFTYQLEADLVVRLTPILDTAELEAVDVTLAATAAEARRTIPLSLMQGWSDGGEEKLRYTPEGEAMAVRVETPLGLVDGTLALDRVEVDWDPIVDTRDQENEA